MAIRKWIAGAFVISYSLQGVGGETFAAPPMPGVETAVALPSLNVITTIDGLILDWTAPPAQIIMHDDGAIRVVVPSYAQTSRPGAPQLPFVSALVALPPGARPTLHTLQIEETTQPLPGRLAVAPRPSGVRRDDAGNPIGGAFASATAVVPAPQHPVELEDIGVMRGVRLARLIFYPARPVGNSLRVTTRIRVSIAFNTPRFASVLRTIVPEAKRSGIPYSGLDAAPAEDPLLKSLQARVINPTQVQAFSPNTREASNFQPPTSTRSVQSPREASNLQPAAVEVSAPGLTAITYEALAGIGFPVTAVDPNSLRLTRAGIEIAAEWDGDADAAFEPGERLLFYADPRFSRYTATDTYFVSIGAEPGLRMTGRSAAPGGQPAGVAWTTETAEINALYTPDCFCGVLPAGRDGDRWTWDTLRRPDRAVMTHTIGLPTVDATQPATLTLWLLGYTDPLLTPDHRVDVSLNGTALGRVEWDGKLAVTATLPITSGILGSGANTVTLTLPGLPGVGVEGAWLDAFAVRYARGTAAVGAAARFDGYLTPHAYTLALATTASLRAYDVTDANRPVRLADVVTTGNTVSLGDPASGGPRRYALASGDGILFPVRLRLTSSLGEAAGADYVIISPINFMPALADLIALRQAQGLSVAVENTQAIYDTYGEGRVDPDAIRAYLVDAYTTWTPPPTFVLLAGDGTSDPKRYRADSPPTVIPPYLAEVDPWAGETAADNRYAAVDGGDNLPDMLIGRLPVNTFTETHIVVGKIVQYETQLFPGDWNRGVALVADNPDAAGNFTAQSEVLAGTFITAPFTAQRIYFTPPATTVTATQQAIVNQWNAGAGLMMFTGHASMSQWAVERLFHREDVPGLSNALRLPVVVEMTCFTGSFQNPSYATLDELLVRRSGGGAIAAWGATGLGVSTGHAELADGFMRSIYVYGLTALGSAALAGKLKLAANNPFHLDLIDTFTLLGDPATRLSLAAAPHAIRLPLIRR